jgi:dihydroorotase
MYISPGWVDLHTHLIPPSHKKIGSPLSRIGAATGVTALLDAGTTGANNYQMFEQHIAAGAFEDVFALINIKRNGIRIRDLYRVKPGLEDFDMMERVRDANPLIKGLKVRASVEDSVRKDPMYYVRKIREAGDRLDLPVMIHIASPPPTVPEILPYMREGDILTHALRSQRHNILDEKGRLRPETRDALERGVLIDIGHGFASFSFEAAERALEEGFTGFTISSDLYSISAPMHARSFANVMTQFLALGMSLEDVIVRASTRPARLLGIEREIALGKPASLTVFSTPSGEFPCKDCVGGKRVSRQRIFPEWTVHKGQIIRAGEVDRKIYSV